MEKLKDLKDLLTHEIQDLYSAEEQIIEALPTMIEKAQDPELKKALKEHLRITEEQKKRLDEIKTLMKDNGGEGQGSEEDSGGEEKKGFFSGLFGGSGNSQVCRGMMGLIEEGQKVMNEDMNQEVLDAAIIGCAQKIEHYEICGYGTAKAYARELNMQQVERLLDATLNEEYDADDKLTELAVGGGLNEEAESGQQSRRSGNRAKRSAASSRSASRGSSGRGSKTASKKSASKAAKKSAPAKKAASARKAAPAKKAASKAAGKKASGGSRSGSSNSGRSKSASKKSAVSSRSVKSSGGRAGKSNRGGRGR